MSPKTEAEPQPQADIVVAPVVLQLKRLTRDLRGRVKDFRLLLDQIIAVPSAADQAGLEMLAGHIARMREQLQVSGEIAAASRSAIARSDPQELTALRDQLAAYLKTLDGARNGAAASETSQPSSITQAKPSPLTSHRPE